MEIFGPSMAVVADEFNWAFPHTILAAVIYVLPSDFFDNNGSFEDLLQSDHVLNCGSKDTGTFTLQVANF